MSLAEELKVKYYSDDGGGRDVSCDFESAINEVIERCALIADEGDDLIAHRIRKLK